MSWVLVQEGQAYGQFSRHREWQISNADEIQSPPPEAVRSAPGSKVFLEDYSMIWNKGNDGTWKEITTE